MVSIMFSHRASSLHQYLNPIPLAKQRCLDAKATNGSEEPGHASVQHRPCFSTASKSTLQEQHFAPFDTMKETESRGTDCLHFHGRYVAPPADTLLRLYIIVAEPPSLLYFRYQQREVNLSAAIARDEMFRHLLRIVPWNVTCSVQNGSTCRRHAAMISSNV
jgi:hypothetical protein